MIDWIIENKEWVFSGIGVLVISAVITGGKYLLRKKCNTNKERNINMNAKKSVYIEKNEGEINIK